MILADAVHARIAPHLLPQRQVQCLAEFQDRH
jgi:hypothetical protein